MAKRLRVYVAGPYSADNVLGVLQNIGRGERAKASLMVGHIHTTDEKYAKNIHNQTIACHCVGTLANMCPAYRPQNDWVAWFAVVELDADGYYRVDNRKIIDGRIV